MEVGWYEQGIPRFCLANRPKVGGMNRVSPGSAW